VSLQDVRVWGDQPQLVIDNGSSTGIHQAWAKINLHKKWATKLGRQEIAYDDQRIFGNVGWAQQARSHDAALLIFQDSSFTGQLGLAFNQSQAQLFSTEYLTPKNYKTIQFLWLHKNWNNLKGSLLFLNNGVQVNFSDGDFQTNFSQTIGGRLTYKKNSFKSNLAFYYQGGTNADTLDTNVNATYFSWDLSYSLKKYFTIMAGVESLSGNDQLDANAENNAFNPFYGTNHKFNGLMDYFYVGNHNGSVGLNDLFFKAIYKKKKLTTSVAVHYFLTNESLADPQNGGRSMNNRLGTEIDYTLGWKFNQETSFHLGYSQLFGTETMEALKGGNRKSTNNWIWAMVTVKPSFTFKKNK